MIDVSGALWGSERRRGRGGDQVGAAKQQQDDGKSRRAGEKLGGKGGVCPGPGVHEHERECWLVWFLYPLSGDPLRIMGLQDCTRDLLACSLAALPACILHAQVPCWRRVTCEPNNHQRHIQHIQHTQHTQHTRGKHIASVNGRFRPKLRAPVGKADGQDGVTSKLRLSLLSLLSCSYERLSSGHPVYAILMS